MKTLGIIGLIFLTLFSLSCVNPSDFDVESYAGKWSGEYTNAPPEPVSKEMELNIDVNGTVISGGGYFDNVAQVYSINGTISTSDFSAVCTYSYVTHVEVIVITIEGTFTSSTSASGTYSTSIDGTFVESGTFSITKSDSGT